jgi:hypothetical protein
MREQEEYYWETIVSDPIPVKDVVVLGNGKDSDLRITLTDGRTLDAGVSEFVVSTDGQVTMEYECIDDLNVQVRYSGPGLELRAGRLGYDDPDEEEEFRRHVREWLTRDLFAELSFVVHAEITLAATSS